MRRIAFACVVAAAASAVATQVNLRAGQSQPPATGLIVGRVVEATTGTAVRGAVVRFASSNWEQAQNYPAVMTDNDGQFVFSAVPAGSFRLFASKFGYTGGVLGRRRNDPDERDPDPLVMATGDRRANVTIRLWKFAAITGAVVDEFGEPAIGVEIRAFPRVFIAGRPRLGAGGDVAGSTDDRGIYRLPRLVAGDYVVALIRSSGSTPLSLIEHLSQIERSGDRDAALALWGDVAGAGTGTSKPGDGGGLRIGPLVYRLDTPPIAPKGDRLFVYPSQFYGGTAQVVTARTIAVRSGQEVTGIDFTMRPVPTVRVSGQVTGDNGPVPNLPIRLTTPGTGDYQFDRLGPASMTLTDAAGRFMLLGVTPGDHVLRALKGPGGAVGFAMAEGVSSSEAGTVLSTGGAMFMPPPSPRVPTYYAAASVAVGDADVTDLAVVVRTGVRLSGQVQFAGTRDEPDPARIKRIGIVVENRDGSMPGWDFEMSGKVTADKKFETVELPPGSYFVRVPNPPDGWTLESVTMDGRDVSDVPLDVSDKALSSLVVKFTDKPATVAGTVQAPSADTRIDDALVIVFPADRARWVDYGGRPRRLQQASVSQDGVYAVRGLPPGDYFVAAVRDDFVLDWHDPAFLAKVAVLATRVTLGAGEQKMQGLTMGQVR